MNVDIPYFFQNRALRLTIVFYDILVQQFKKIDNTNPLAYFLNKLINISSNQLRSHIRG